MSQLNMNALKALLNHVKTAIAVFDTDMRFVLVSNAWSDMHGREPAKIIGESHYTVFPDLPEHIRAVHQRALAGEHISADAERFEWSDGSVQYIDWTIEPWYEVDGTIGGVVLLTDDVTQRIENQYKLLDTEDLLRNQEADLERHLKMLGSMERVANIGSWVVDVSTGRIEWSEQTRRIHEVPDGFQPTLETGVMFYEPGESRDRITQAISHCIETGEGWDLELTIITAKGRRIWVRAQGEGEFKDGVCVRLFGVFQNINAQHELKEREALEKRRLQLVLEGSQLGSWDWNPETGELVVDDRWCRMIGYERSEIEPNTQGWSSRVHPEDLKECYKDILSLIRGTDAQYSKVFRMRHKDGRWVYIHARGQLLRRDEQGNPLRFAGTHEDVTAQQLELIQRKQLYSMTAHELRTPLSALSMMTTTQSDAEWCSYKPLFANTLNEVFHTLDDMRMLINPSLSRPTRIEPVNLTQFNESIVVLTTGIVTTNGFKFDLISDLPEEVRQRSVLVDAYRLRAAITNLIKNACVHSEGSRVTVKCTVHAQDSEQPRVLWIVEDDGVGIDAETLSGLFQPHARGNSRAEGTGMGLFISRSWIEEIGGSLVYEAREQGSRFCVCVPLKYAETENLKEPSKDAPSSVVPDNFSVLLVEDEATLRMLGQKILSSLGVRVDVASNGQEALELLNNSYDLVVTDYYMPLMDGRTLIETARSNGLTTPMVMLTAASLTDELDKLQNSGADAVLIKPLTTQLFRDLIDRLTREGKITAQQGPLSA